MATAPRDDNLLHRLGLWDATSLVLGIIVGVGIFSTPMEIFQKAPGPWQAMWLWVVGGMLALVGALCFAELAAAYPQSGGEYVYLSRAFGPWVSYLYAWAQLALIRPASIGAVAYVFAENASELWGMNVLFWTFVPVALLTLFNILGVSFGTTIQNLLTIAKVLGLAAIVVFGFLATHGPVEATVQAVGPTQMVSPPPVSSTWMAAGLLLVLFSYAGWHEAAYIAGEVKDSRRNLPLALIFGTLAVMAIYLLFNGALLWAFGFSDAKVRLPADVVPGDAGPRLVSILIMVSALGAVNGMIITTARIYSAFGLQHRLFSSLGHWSKRYGTPVRALIVQGIVSLGYIVAVGWAGKILFRFKTGGESLGTWVLLTSAVFWFFFLLTGISLFILRYKEPHIERPFKVPLYPLLPIVFCLSCVYLIVGAVQYKPLLSFFGLLAVLAGIPFYWIPSKRKRPPTSGEPAPAIEPIPREPAAPREAV